MSGSNIAPNYHSLVPSGTGASLYLLQVEHTRPEETAGTAAAIPVHLLISEVPIQNINLFHQNQSLPLVSNNIARQPVINSARPIQKVTFKSSQIHQTPPKPNSSQSKSLPNVEVKSTENLQGSETRSRKEPVKSTYIEKKPLESHKVRDFIHIPDRIVPPRALAVLPTALVYRRGSFYPKRKLPPKVRFGPVEGVTYKIFPAEADELVIEAAVTNKPIFLINKEEECVTYINVTNKETSNWFSLLPLGNASQANIWLYEEDDQLYGVTTEFISTRTPLAIGYSRKYAKDHKLPRGQPVLDIDEALSQHKEKWWCFECHRGLGSPVLLQRHINVYHKEDRPTRWKYRCKFCLRSFRRLFTLRRHTSQHCEKKPVKSSTKITTESDLLKKSTPEIIVPQNTEENRIPSDESFQNYTTGLDFSTNLFDTDRISNLDISGSSKSENDFNPYTGILKFENLDNNDEYNKFSEGLISPNEKKLKEQDQEEVTCPQCKQTMTKARKRRHLRECPARRLECECGRVFRRKETLAQHIFTEHNQTQLIKSENDLQKDTEVNQKRKEPEYDCHECNHKFKRRGMLVNHLWRVHQQVNACVPVERRERLYPCAVCPKLYRTASKRDIHVHNHHPGLLIRAAPIEGEKKSYEAAKCSACPRQYVTRAKLLQHIRATHPELASILIIQSSRTTSISSIRSTSPKNKQSNKLPIKQETWPWNI